MWGFGSTAIELYKLVQLPTLEREAFSFYYHYLLIIIIQYFVVIHYAAMAPMCSSSEAGSYLRLIHFVYHSALGLRLIKKKLTMRHGACRDLHTPLTFKPRRRRA